MNTLQISDNLDPNTSEGRRVITVSNELVKRGYGVTVVAATPGGQESDICKMLDPEVNLVWHKPLFKFSCFHYSPNLSGLLSGLDFDIIHAHSYRHYGTYIGAQTARETDKPYILSPYGSLSYGSVQWFKLLYKTQDILTKNLPLEASAKILANTRYEKEDIVKHGIDHSRVDIIFREVDTSLFKKIDSVPDEHKIVYVGRVTPIKGIELIIDSLQLVEPDVVLEIIGPIEDMEYYRGLQKQAQNLGVQDRVIFQGLVPYEKIPAQLSSAIALVLPSYFENLGGVLLEAQACQCPVIATNIGGIPEMLKHNETGYLLSERSPHELASRINYLASEKAARHHMGEKGREFVSSMFSPRSYVGRITDAYIEALELKGRA